MNKLLYVLSFLTGPLLKIEAPERVEDMYRNQPNIEYLYTNHLLDNHDSNNHQLVDRIMPNDVHLLVNPEHALANAPKEFQNFFELIKLNPIPGHILPKGFIMHGPPGTGKTELAKVLAKQTGFAFYNLSGGQTGSKFINETANNIKHIFDQIRRELSLDNNIYGAILFIDEIEAIAPSRESNLTHQEDTKALTILLQEIEGIFTHEKPILVIGATNIINKVDNALISRLQKIAVLPPKKNDRLTALQHLMPKFFENIEGLPDSWIEHIAHNSNGLSYRDLVEICKDAATRRYIGESLNIDVINKLIQKRYL